MKDLVEKSEEQSKYEKFMCEFKNYMMDTEDGENFESFYSYGPLTNKYWTFKPRILICNLEPYDEREGEVIVDIDLYKEWITVHTGNFAAKFITGLIKVISGEIEKEFVNFRQFRRVEAIKYMENVAYLNFRISSGKRVRADKKGTLEEVKTFKNYLIDQINNLSPDIIIVGGVDGCNAFNLLFATELKFGSTITHNKKIISSIKHFSRANYKNYNEKINEIIARMNNSN